MAIDLDSPPAGGVEPFWDPEIYERERERIFGRDWLFVGHTVMIPAPGDYVTNFMGDDPVIVCRDKGGTPRVLLNRCRHRGNKVCLYDKGNAKSFRCSYHGWTYATSGELAAVPLLAEAYDGDFRREDWGLVEAPRVASYRGLIFASWDPAAPELEDYLGEVRWYLDRFALDDPDGWELLPGKHRYMVPGNWKLLSENFGGDSYHFASTHASVNTLSHRGQTDRIPVGNMVKGRRHGVQALGAGGVPHGLLGLAIGDEFFAADLRTAERVSVAAAAWVSERHRRRQSACADREVRPYGFHTGTIWPNLSMNGFGTALYGRSFLQWHPRGPESTEVTQWCFVEKSAPLEVTERMSFTLSQRTGAAGMVAPDDVENFQRMHDALHSAQAKRLGFNYELAKATDERSLIPELPGHVCPEVSESYQRAFYRHWHDVMG
jgi:phenylpropionate dioxygenase-like ring-hydroxylating dioxygenase large terminal subunit